jgi:hypothetical protein
MIYKNISDIITDMSPNKIKFKFSTRLGYSKYCGLGNRINIIERKHILQCLLAAAALLIIGCGATLVTERQALGINPANPPPPAPSIINTNPLIITYNVTKIINNAKSEICVYNCIIYLRGDFNNSTIHYCGSPITPYGINYNDSGVSQYLREIPMLPGESESDWEKRTIAMSKTDCAIGDDLFLSAAPEKAAAASITLKLTFDVTSNNGRKLIITDADDASHSVSLDIPPHLDDPIIWYALCASQVFKQSALKSIKEKLLVRLSSANGGLPAGTATTTILEDK